MVVSLLSSHFELLLPSLALQHDVWTGDESKTHRQHGLHEMKGSDHGCDRASRNRPVPTPRR